MTATAPHAAASATPDTSEHAKDRAPGHKTSCKDVYVITGGSGGMGYATALQLGKSSNAENIILLISGHSEVHLTEAAEGLAHAGIAAEIHTEVCDVASPDDVLHLADTAARLGHVRGVIHTAGVSPSMDEYQQILATNSLGTIYVNRAFLSIADEGFTMVNVSSMAAYMLPDAMLPTRVYKAVKIGPNALFKKLDRRCRLLPPAMRAQMAYPISKNFVNWYTRHLSGAYGEHGAHIVSVSPGSFDTTMGQLEKDAGAGAMVDFAAIKRFGDPSEVATLLSWLVLESPVYLTGTDILIDGGVVANMTLKDMMSAGKSSVH
ncbi:MAG: SDR family oxidoreductase [Bifidobacteriaceae bacterium]|jgi:NAD(P)-dependent dehydrogenase (short-subunit alcohol dehydrogenase family)|nr:SDR family oxidoreductase [Bifidobacteriaceae bacterium]